jgi:hypothetical protein
MGSGFRVQGSASPPARKTAGQIELETSGLTFKIKPVLGFAFQNITGQT